MMRVLILCTGNSARSQMAEALLRCFDRKLDVHSAGTEPAARVNPLAIDVMRELGIDIASAKPKSVEPYLGQPFDFVITVCDHANETCPVFTGRVGRREHIGFQDPVTPEDFRRVRDEIRARLLDFWASEMRGIRPARADDVDAVLRLMKNCSLPTDGIDLDPNYVVAEHAGAIVACAGIEMHGDYGLLRSVAVDANLRGSGLGAALVRERLERARNLKGVYLLTTTAAGFFTRLGFRTVDRDTVPEPIRQSQEFRHTCPASATVMAR